MLALLFAPAEDNAARPLFARRGMLRCSWPLWNGDEPLNEKRCCGRPVETPGKPYCETHEIVAAGPGTPSERRVDRDARALLKGERDA